MKKIIASLLAITFMAATIPAFAVSDTNNNEVKTVGENMVLSGGFDSTTGWTVKGNVLSSFGGRSVAKLEKDNEITQSINLAGGKRYYIGVWQKPDKDNGSYAEVKVSIKDGSTIMYETEAQLDMNAKYDSSWTETKWLVEIPADCTNANVTFTAKASNGNFPVYVDDFQVIEIAGDNQNTAGLVKVTKPGEKIKVTVTNESSASEMKYLGINGGGSQYFDEASRYMGDGLWTFNRQFIGNGMPANTYNRGNVRTKEQFDAAVAEVVANPDYNSYVHIKEDLALYSAYSGYGAADLFSEAQRLGHEMEIQHGPWWNIGVNDYYNLFGEWLSAFYSAYTMAPYGVTKHAIMNEPDQNYFSNYESVIKMYQVCVDGIRKGCEAAGVEAEIWGPTFAGGDVVKNVDKITRDIAPYTDVYCFNKYSPASSFANAMNVWRKYLAQNCPEDANAPVANTEFNYKLNDPDPNFVDRIVDALGVTAVQQTAYDYNYLCTNYFIFGKTFSSHKNIHWGSGLLRLDDVSGRYFTPVKTYYALRMTNRAMKYPSEKVVSNNENLANGQVVTVIKNDDFYYVLFRNDLVQGVGNFEIDLTAVGIKSANVTVRQLSEVKNDEIVDSYSIANGVINQENVPGKSATLFVITRNGKTPTAPVIHRQFEQGQSNEIWWINQHETDYYKILRSTNGGAFELVRDMCQESYFTDENVKIGESYKYRIVPVNGNGEGAYAETMNLKPIDDSTLLPMYTDLELSDVGQDIKVLSGDWEVYKHRDDNVYRVINADGEKSRVLYGNSDDSVDFVHTKFYANNIAEGTKMGIVFKYTDENNHYRLEADKTNDKISVYKIKNGQSKLLGTKSVSGGIDQYMSTIDLENVSFMIYAIKEGDRITFTLYDKLSGNGRKCMLTVRDTDAFTTGCTGFFAEGFGEIGFDSINTSPYMYESFNDGVLKGVESGSWSITGDSDKSVTNSTDGRIILGHEKWQDYLYAVKVTPEKFAANSFMSAYYSYKDNSNYFAVELYKDKAELVCVVNGVKEVIESVPYSAVDGETYTIVAKRDKNLHTVLINGVELICTMAENKVAAGKAGFGATGMKATFDEAAINRNYIYQAINESSSDDKQTKGIYDDTNGHWAEFMIQEAAKKGLVNGVDDYNFNPNGTITRAEFITIVERVFGIKEVNFNNAYADVNSNDWFAGEIQAAKDMGIIPSAMIENGNVSPNKPITREEMATVIYNTYTKKSYKVLGSNSAAGYSDYATVSDWAKDGIDNVVKMGVMQGDTMNNLNPRNNATRAEATVMLKRLSEDLQTYNRRLEKSEVLDKALVVDAPVGNKLTIASVSATSEPEKDNHAQNLIDGDINTRWSYEGDQNAVVDLGEVKTVTSVGLAFFKGNIRTQEIEIYLSEDGKNYGLVFSGNNSGKTVDLQFWKFKPIKARYVKIRSIKASTGAWQSLNEIAVYGE